MPDPAHETGPDARRLWLALDSPPWQMARRDWLMLTNLSLALAELEWYRLDTQERALLEAALHSALIFNRTLAQVQLAQDDEVI